MTNFQQRFLINVWAVRIDVYLIQSNILTDSDEIQHLYKIMVHILPFIVIITLQIQNFRLCRNVMIEPRNNQSSVPVISLLLRIIPMGI